MGRYLVTGAAGFIASRVCELLLAGEEGLFRSRDGARAFSAMLRAFVQLRINHVQFNVVRKEDLLAAQKDPDAYRNLTIRVAGYTAYFTELAAELQNEIIARTSFEDA